jgi:hypothetical protein
MKEERDEQRAKESTKTFSVNDFSGIRFSVRSFDHTFPPFFSGVASFSSSTS